MSFDEDQVNDLMQWMALSDSEVLSKFAKLDGAIINNDGLFQSVFVPGHRSDRVLLVAHADTVFWQRHILYNNGLFFSPHVFNHNDRKIWSIKTDTLEKFEKKEAKKLEKAKKDNKNYEVKEPQPAGIGADDRAGCAILWQLKQSGHSLLITNKEESGCLGAISLTANTELYDEINNTHQYAIEFDRKGNKNCVFYSVSTPEFEKFFCENTNFTKQIGSNSDISVICESICGVNMSVGYYNEHSQNEILSLRHWNNSLNAVAKLLNCPNQPKWSR